ncbi:aminopeptidase P N-terminal domain-containing protein [Candidatus Saccharibacteria bacterium]|nr:aminopeptidase P N-terminal domain-containing protein [Candidatus Saccharibacteria bacterium]
MEFNADFFRGNRRRLPVKAGTDLIVIAANGLLQSSADNTFPFKQNSNFWYLTGIDEPDTVLVINGTDEFLIVPPRDKIRVIFDGAIDKLALSQTSGINQVMDNKDGWLHLASILKKTKKAGTILPPPPYVRQMGFHTNPAPARLRRRIKTINKKIAFIDLRQQLANMRIIKQLPELAALQKAVDITVDSFKEVLARRQKFDWEYQIAADLDASFRRRGANGPAFPTITASGPNACILHYNSNNHKLRSKDLVLIDAGAEVSHYASDITRTIALATPSVRQQEVFDAVLSVQKFAISLLKPGAVLEDYTAKIDKFMGDQLLSLGLIKKNNAKNVRQYWPHSVSHFLGLDVHDGRGWHQPLAAGMVLTVEPGIYIPEEGIGIRIEDDILITDTGNKVLSAALVRKLI